MEQWKKIEDFNYKISNKGNIKNSRGKVVRPYVNFRGYLVISLHKEGKRYHKIVHRMVAHHFKSEIDLHYFVRHIDGDIKNNDADNLEVIPMMEHRKRKGVYRKTNGVYCGTFTFEGCSIYTGASKDENEAKEMFREKFKKVRGFEPWAIIIDEQC